MGTTRIGRGQSPTWSPDGSRIAYVKRRHIWTMAADGTERIQVTSGPHYDYAPSWSPSGGRLVFASGRGPDEETDLFIATIARPLTRPVRVMHTEAEEFDAEWSPDGTRVAFGTGLCGSHGCSGYHIGVVHVDGTHRRVLTTAMTTDLLRTNRFRRRHRCTRAGLSARRRAMAISG